LPRFEQASRSMTTNRGREVARDRYQGLGAKALEAPDTPDMIEVTTSKVQLGVRLALRIVASSHAMSLAHREQASAPANGTRSMRVQSFQTVAVHAALVVNSSADLFDQQNSGLARDVARIPGDVTAKPPTGPFRSTSTTRGTAIHVVALSVLTRYLWESEPSSSVFSDRRACYPLPFHCSCPQPGKLPAFRRPPAALH
jgi:hypothetical protein